jgi:hypothetical protein
MIDTEITFKDFASLARRRGHSPDSLAHRFKGKIENPAEFFHRVMQEKFAVVVIPYRSVLAFYTEELHYFKDTNPRQRRCACGCDQPVFDRQKWAAPGCKKRIQRKQSATANSAVASA